ncbi:hypothetical protein UMM65_07280 [Aureibaculum sp. 2210JD6-5]|uniref:hypothetical protein n=1 Tax=Aureibaculum sp. 2210JD6-5 TaxID=3103957 RepID=UPI002AAE3226|nr:hypothetical protein [Aureibaculum sp. 2210JD6-5]MDY7395038.1 hypothetical protein [Aureibaculum sp. 2210JD6-5]
MANSTVNKPPVWFWIVSVVALIWNGMGVDQYLGQAYQTERWKSMYSAEQLEIANNVPTWYTAVFAIAVFGGFLGCIALLLRKKFAYTLFLISLIAIIVQMSYVIFSLKMANVMTPMIIVVGVLLVWLAKSATKKGWIS